MKKLTSILLCAIMIMTMMSMTLSASAASIQLPDGGQTTNCGCEIAYGYTSGGRSGKVYIVCSLVISKGTSSVSSTATLTARTEVESSGYLGHVFYYTTGSTSMDIKNFPTAVQSSFVYTRYTGLKAYEATCAHSYTADGYGDWICGTLAEV